MMEGAPVMEPVGAMLGVAVSLGEVEGVPVGEHSAFPASYPSVHKSSHTFIVSSTAAIHASAPRGRDA